MNQKVLENIRDLNPGDWVGLQIILLQMAGEPPEGEE